MGGVKCPLALLIHTKIDVSGTDNDIIISYKAILKNVHIHISGSHNKVYIGDFSTLKGVEIWIEDDNNEVVIGKHSTFEGNVHIACIEGQKIHIGKDCMFSANIDLRTGDSHSIIDMEGKRINPSKNIKIGEHVWCGTKVSILKGSVISDESIIGTGSIVTRQFNEKNVVIAGNPAMIVKKEITWERERLPL